MRRAGFGVVLVFAAVAMVGAGCGGDDDDNEGAAATEGGTEKTSAEPIEVGAALSLTGKLAREGVLTREGYDHCLDVVNDAGGVKVEGDGRPLKIDYQDDQSVPDTAAQLVDSFNDQDLKLLLGPYGSPSTEAAAPVVERNGQVMVEGAGSDNKLFQKGYTRLFAVLSPASEYLVSMLKALAEIAEPKPKTVAIIGLDEGFAKTTVEAAEAEASELGFEIVAIETVPAGNTDLSAALTKVKAKRPDVVLGAVRLQEGIALMRQAKELGVNPGGGFGEIIAPPIPDFVETLGPAAEYVIGSTQWTPQTPGRDDLFGSAAEYDAAFAERFGHPAEYHNAEATAACLALVKAIEAAGSTEPDAVREALVTLDLDSFFGRIRFDAEGKNIYKPMSVIQIQDGKPVTVWPRTEASAPLRWPTPAFGAR